MTKYNWEPENRDQEENRMEEVEGQMENVSHIILEYNLSISIHSVQAHFPLRERLVRILTNLLNSKQREISCVSEKGQNK